MKKVLLFVVIGLAILVVFCFVYYREAITPVVSFVQNEAQNLTPKNTGSVELCFASFGTPDKNGFYDIDTLRLILDGDKVKGELNMLPGGKDSKTGEFEGIVGAVDKIAMARTADLWWFSLAEGNSIKEQLKIIFDENKASVGFGEMVDRGDGVYVYKDVKNISYTLNIPKIACLNLIVRANVENYLQDNIAELSPVKPILGGSWYIISKTVDLEKKSGTVVYEDGHIQESKTFSYTVDEKGAVTSMIIN